MSKLFKRAWKVEIRQLTGEGATSVFEDTQTIEQLRIRFKVAKTLEKEPNALSLKITNLAERSRAKLSKFRARIILTAGYESQAAVIFSGDTRTVDHVREGCDWTTNIQCGDGEHAYQWARISESFAPGARLADVLRACAKKMDLNAGNLEDAIAKGLKFESFSHGYAAFGPASKVFDSLVRAAGYSWSIQQGAIQILKAGQPIQETAFLISPTTGLIGSPDHTPPDHKGKPSTLKFKCFLNPQIRPGNIVRVEAVGVKGEFILQKLDHEGDSHGKDWVSTCEAIART